MRQTSPTWRLANYLLAGHIDAVVADARAQGKGWRVVARDLWVATDGRVDVTHETVRRWYEDLNGDAA